MNPKPFHDDNTGDSRSRFAYHNELEATEGGVKPVTETAAPKAERKSGRPSHITAGTNGVPGAGDRLLDISEIARTVGQYYKHAISIARRDGDELEIVEPITGEVTLTNTGDALILRGKVQTTLALECARCLRPVLTFVETDIEEEFDLVGENSAWGTADTVQAVDDDETGAVIKGNILDLGDLLRQYLILAAPTWVECTEGCDPLPLPAGVAFIGLSDDVATAHAPAADSPLKHLAELLAEKEKRAGQ